MAIQVINTGSSANKGDGDSLRTAFHKINNNFAFLSTGTASSGPSGPQGYSGYSGPQGYSGYSGAQGTSGYSGAQGTSGYSGYSGQSVDLNTVSNHIIPSLDLTYDLGSTSSQWRSLYVGTSTIYLGGAALSVSDGNLTVNGNPISGGTGGSADRITSSTYSVILEGTTGTVSVPNSIISQGYQLNLAGSQYSYGVGRYLRVRDGDVESHLHLDTPDNSLYDIILGDDSKFVRVDHTGTVVIGTNDETQRLWTFGTDGKLTLAGNITRPVDQSVQIEANYNISTLGQEIVADDNQGGITNNIINVWVSGAATNYPDIVNVQAGWTVTGTGLTNSLVTAVQLTDLGGGLTIYQITVDTPSEKMGYTYTFTEPPILSVGTSTWAFGTDGTLTFPDGTTSTGASVYVPYATSSSYKITTEVDMLGSYLPQTFEVIGDRIKLPDGNGLIQSGNHIEPWSLDSLNKSFTFPNQSDIEYGDGTYLSTGSLRVRVDLGGEFSIFLGESNKTWTFDNNGSIGFPDGSIQTTAYTGTNASTTASTIDITNTNGLGTTYYLTFVENRTAGQEVRADVDLTYETADNILGTGQLRVNSSTSAASTNSGALQVVGGAGVGGSVVVGGNVTANKFVGDGSSLTNVTINVAGDIVGTGTNVSLVAGSYTATFDNTGVLTLPTIGGDEGGEINFGIPTTNTTLVSTVKVDVFQDRFRIFDGSTKGAYIDLSQAATGVGTLLNNRVSGFVDAGTFVTMDNIRATVTTSGQRGLSLATVSGFFTYNIGGTYGAGVGSGGASLADQTLTTTPTTSIFGWGFVATGDISTYIITNTSSMQTYRITVQIGASFNNNSIIIERLI